MLQISAQTIDFLLQQKKSDISSLLFFFKAICDGELIDENRIKFSTKLLDEKQKDDVNFSLAFFVKEKLCDFEKAGDEIIFTFKENSLVEFHPLRGATKQYYIIYNITNNVLNHNSTDSTLKVERKKSSLQNTEQYHFDVCDHLNKVCGTRYKADSVTLRKLITQKIKAGYTVEQIKKVIDVKAKDWLGNDRMAMYLRPKTLFGNNFDSYVNDPRVLKAEKVDDAHDYLKKMMEA